MLKTKDDYFALSRQQALPNRCPLLDRCERRADTVAIANNWNSGEAPGRLAMKAPLVESVGDPAYLIGGVNNFIIGGQCPEVGLFESTMAIAGLSGSPLTSGRYDKSLSPQYEVLETGHFSECAEYVSANHNSSSPPAPTMAIPPVLAAPDKITLKWLFAHVPVSYWICAATALGTMFYAGLQASETSIVREFFHVEATREHGAGPSAKGAAPRSTLPV
jgi:hypothetical protein